VKQTREALLVLPAPPVEGKSGRFADPVHAGLVLRSMPLRRSGRGFLNRFGGRVGELGRPGRRVGSPIWRQERLGGERRGGSPSRSSKSESRGSLKT
jgi:hypothetical protein